MCFKRKRERAGEEFIDVKGYLVSFLSVGRRKMDELGVYVVIFWFYFLGRKMEDCWVTGKGSWYLFCIWFLFGFEGISEI